MLKNFLQLLFLGLMFNVSLLSGEESEKAESEASCESKDKEDNKDKEDKKDKDDKEDKKDKDDKDEKEEEEEPPKIGNFALPTSQQPAALFGFGGNIIDKGEVQLYFFADDIAGRKRTTVDLIPSVLFGITKDWSIFFNFPFSPYMEYDNHRSGGLEDFFVQLEYAFYNKSTAIYQDQATVVANVTFPTGSIKKNPPTGFGAPSFFVGGTYYHMMVDWFVFVAPGAVLTTSECGFKIGDQFLYQFGFGRNIPSPCGWIYAWMIEVDGQYNQKNRIACGYDENTGGNTILVTPSGWISTKEMLFQFGVSFPITQNLFGNQHKVDYVINLNFAWSFY